MDKKKIFFYTALGVAAVGAILALVGGIVGSLSAFDVSVDDIISGGEELNAVISGVALLLATPLALVGTGFIAKKTLLSPILLALAAIISFVSLISFNITGLLAGVFLLGGTALAVLNWLWAKGDKTVIQDKKNVEDEEAVTV